jgi:hypothetical protein
MATTYSKDPAAVLDYRFDWTLWLVGGETITDYTVTVSGAGLVKDSDAEDGGMVTVWLSGGTPGIRCTVACQVTTSAGRTDERSIHLQVRDR